MSSRFGLLICIIAMLVFSGCGGSSSSSGTNVNDTEPPDWDNSPTYMISNFRSLGAGDGQVTLAWNAAVDNIGVSHYLVTNIKLSQTVNVGNVTTYDWTGLNNGEPYTFTMAAVDGAGNVSITQPETGTVGDTPEEPDATPPEEVSSPAGVGMWDSVAKNYRYLRLGWGGSGSSDISHYLLSVSSESPAAFPGDIVDDYDIGNVNQVEVPLTTIADGVPAGALPGGLPTYYFEAGEPYTVRVIAVDIAGNQSAGVTFVVTPTDSVNPSPALPITGLRQTPDNQFVTLDWDLLSPEEGSSYRVYYRRPLGNPGPLLTDEDIVPWTLSQSVATNTATVTGLTNGALYQFMVCAVNISGTECVGAVDSAGDPSPQSIDDFPANWITSIPTSNAIFCAPNIEGGVFREGNFAAQHITITVSSNTNTILDDTAEIWYTLDGSEINTADPTIDATRGHYALDPALVDVIDVILADAMYAVTIDFEPDGSDTYTLGGDVQYLAENSLRPDGSPDHILLKYMIKAANDASPVYNETYLIYPDMPGNALQNEYMKFSGMRGLRSGATATYVKGQSGSPAGDTAGDIIFIGGYESKAGTSLNTGERYRTTFEHFEDFYGNPLNITLTPARSDHNANLLDDGYQILVTGGTNDAAAGAAADGIFNRSLGLRTFEIFNTNTQAGGDEFTAGGTMDTVRRYHTSTQLYDGSILVTGGLNGQIEPLAAIWSAPWVAVGAGPSANAFEHVVEPADYRGYVVEILDAPSGSVVQTGILTAYPQNGTTMNYIYTISGFQSDVASGDLFRLINLSTADAEFFTAVGGPLGVADDGAALEMQIPRFGHSATLLQDGTVFIAGGNYNYTGGTTQDELMPELFDPNSGPIGAFSKLDGEIARLGTTRFFHQAVLLQDGKVLLCGGVANGDLMVKDSGFRGVAPLSSAELYDPYSRSVKSVGSMTKGRLLHSAALLPSGKVLICGGAIGATAIGQPVMDNSAEIYDPASESFTSTGLMLTQRGQTSITVIKDATSPIYGQAIVAGGAHSELAERYNEITGQFEATAHGVIGDRFIGSVATALSSGNVLITGGQTDEYYNGNTKVPGLFLHSAEEYNSSAIRFERTSGDLQDNRRHHTATLMQDDSVLITGGENETGGLSGAEIYDPVNKYFSQTADMLQSRYKHTATLLLDGRVFVCGGANVGVSLESCEIYNPVSGFFVGVPSMNVGRYDHTASLLPNGWVLVTGGEGIDSTSVEVYNPVANEWVTDAAWSTVALNVGRDGHTGVQPVYSIGKARFENGSATVTGTDGSEYNVPATAWASSDVKIGDIIICLADRIPYMIAAIGGDQTLTLGDIPGASYDDSGYSGVSTTEKLVGATLIPTMDQGFEDYAIISQDVYIAGGEVTETSTDVYAFGDSDIWFDTDTSGTYTAGDTVIDSLYDIWLPETATPTAGITGLLVYESAGTANVWEAGEDVWLDDIAANQIYDAGETLISDGGDGYTVTDTTVGSNVDILFFDKDGDGSFDLPRIDPGMAMPSGRYGHIMTSTADMRLLISGGLTQTTGMHTTNDNDGVFTDDVWTSKDLDPIPTEWVFLTAFRAANNMIIVIRGHSAQAFFTE
ncbi:kelch repeat-containing protein [Planctomycetota bacterium]